MIRSLSIAAVYALLAGSASAQRTDSTALNTDLTLVNRERTLRFTLLMVGDSLDYQVDRLTPDGAISVIEPSPLGIARTSEDFTRGLTLVSAARVTEVTDVYRMTTGKQRDIRSRARQRVFTFRSASGAPLTITVRAYEDGIAFRYGFPRGVAEQDSVTGEATGFHLPLGGRAWMQPYQKVSTWAPAYESDYQNAIPIGTPAPDDAGWAMPMLFHINDSWVLITEAGLDRSSYAVHLEQRAGDGVYRVRLPEDAETYDVGPRAAALKVPWLSPWRVIMVGPTLGMIVESTLVTDLAPPATFSDVSWIRPGRVSWSWWSDRASPRDYQKAFPFVDLARRMGWEYSLVDLGWQEMTNGGDIGDLIDYATKSGVGVLLWYNSGGEHNQVPDAGPKELMVDPSLRMAEMRRIRALGVKGIKVDFMQSDKQYVIALYEDILRDAAANRLVVDFHGSTIPRGWQRTYPNLLSMEAVKGAEQYGDTAFQRNAAMFNTIYPFTRNVIGSMDYTPMIFGTAPGMLPNLTTNAHELALSVVFESGLQHFVSSPAMIDSQPLAVRQFLQVVPTVWDETRFIDGYPGRLAVLARRRGTDWYVAGINGDTAVARAEVPLRFLGSGTYGVELISDGEEQRSFAHAATTLTVRDTMTVELAAQGGFVARLVARQPARARPAAATTRAPATRTTGRGAAAPAVRPPISSPRRPRRED
ncbi:MAG: glycoside hydrolase family 97 catalytic domain-containing protein [Gemmatimonadaceae bacterium]